MEILTAYKRIKFGDSDVPGGDRSFGCVFAVVFAIIGLLPLAHAGPVRLWPLGVAGLFLVLALLVPNALHPLNVLWFRFGIGLNKIMTPFIMAAVFFSTVTPIGVISRLCGMDPLRLKFDRPAKSYWIIRHPPGPPDVKSFNDQF